MYCYRFYCLEILLAYFYYLYSIKNRKVVSIWDPLPIPTLRKNILKITANNLNLAIQVANPAWKDSIFMGMQSSYYSDKLKQI
jgi:hypothetical protein